MSVFTVDTFVILTVIVLGIIFISIIRNQGYISGQKEEYERIAGTFLKAGDIVPEWVVKKSWKLIGKVPINRGGHPDKPKRNILICESIVLTGTPRIFIIEALPSQRTPQGNEIFNISEKGEPEFNRQPNL